MYERGFVTYELAVKLKEKGFECMYPIAMYNEKGVFHELYTSVGNMQYYDYDDFDERDTIAPTISQVLKWLREEKKIVISIFPHSCGWQADIYKDVHQYYDSEAECYLMHYYKEKTEISHSFNWLEIYCIQYVLDNLI